MHHRILTNQLMERLWSLWCNIFFFRWLAVTRNQTIGVIIGCVCGALLIVVLITLFCCLLRNKKTKQGNQGHTLFRTTITSGITRKHICSSVNYLRDNSDQEMAVINLCMYLNRHNNHTSAKELWATQSLCLITC